MLTIAYITTRKDPKLHWFLDSLSIQVGLSELKTSIVVVSFNELDGHEICGFMDGIGIPVGIVKPKPTVWQGPSRLTKENWFAASNARNTALCYAPDGWIAYVDDLSVLMPGWLQSVRDAMAGNYIALGAYKKVKNLKVENGVAVSYEDFPGGLDSRWSIGRDDGPGPAQGDWMYGCSVAMPVEALLAINGWPEFCDSISAEDYCCGASLQNSGYTFKYDRRMLTLESEEDHHREPSFRREDWHFENGKPVQGGNGHDDCSHSCLNIARQSKWYPHYLGDGFSNMRELRSHILNGGQFPIRKHPEHHWFTGTLLSEL